MNSEPSVGPLIGTLGGYVDTAIQGVLSILRPSWPQVALIAFIVVVWKFRVSLTKLIERIESFGAGGVKFAPPREAGHPLPTTVAPATPPVLGELPTVAAQVQRIYADLNQNPVYAGLDNDRRIEVLVKHLAFFQFAAWCEREYRIIFGSQIRLLKLLQQRATVGATKADVQAFTDTLEKSFPALYEAGKPYRDVDTYMAFLKETGAVREDNGVYFIQAQGADFLVWLASTGLTEEKFG